MLRMKRILLLVVSCLFLQNGRGAPHTAVYQFVKCQPGSNQANCLTQKAEIPWSPNLPSKLPASVGKYLNAKHVEDESSLNEEVDEIGKGMEDEKTAIRSEDGESPDMFVGDEGSGESEGSAPWVTAAEMGSGDYWTDNLQQEGESFYSNFPVGETKPTEEDLKEDHLLTP